MNFLFAWRYFRSKKTTNAINIIAWISVLAIAVGTAALIIVLSVFNGFEDLVKGLYGDFYADLRVTPAQGKFIRITPRMMQEFSKVNGVKKLSLIAEEKAVLVNGDYQAIVYLKGVDEHYKEVSNVQQHIDRGNYNLGTVDEPALVIGGGIQSATGADPERGIIDLALYLPNRDAKNFSVTDAMNSFNVVVSGVFRVQEEFDNKYAFTNLPFVQYMLNLKPDEYSSIEISLANRADATAIKNALQKVAGNKFLVQTRFEQNQSLFTVMEVEKWFIYGILSLILVVAAFNMIGALTMLVLEKQKDIAVLKAMGAGNKLIQNIFLSSGFLLAFIGGVIGIVLAVCICILQVKFKLIKLQGGSFIIDYYPVKMVPADFLLVSLTVFIVAILAAWIPSRKAAQQSFSLKS